MKSNRINLIYLAAGYSRRFGNNKLTSDVDGKPLFRYGLECILKLKELLEQGSTKEKGIVPERDNVKEQSNVKEKSNAIECVNAKIQSIAKEPGSIKVQDHAVEQHMTVHPVVVTAYNEIESYCIKRQIACVRNEGTGNDGMASSINVGIKLCEETEQSDARCKETGTLCYDMFFTADQPNLDADELYTFINAFLAHEHTIGAMEYQGILRNPGIFFSCWRRDFKRLCGDRGGKIIRDAHRDDVFVYHTASGNMFLDIDTREDYCKLAQQFAEDEIAAETGQL